jgi:hypothetical protein
MSNRIVERHQQDEAADPDPAGARGDRRRRRQQCGIVAVLDKMVFREPAIVEAELLHADDFVQLRLVKLWERPAPRFRIPEIEHHAHLHRALS